MKLILIAIKNCNLKEKFIIGIIIFFIPVIIIIGFIWIMYYSFKKIFRIFKQK